MSNDRSKQRRGIWKADSIGGLEAYAQVADVNGGNEMPLDESLYRARGYEPPFDVLPTQAEYEARRK
ncbi:hypothetical protein [Oceanicaulis sp. UBA2681]|uniref:hypothetical protein n=1 Tax=Oceanicaulis sp. UBA2681 TaxID=1947007 RepID=UPI002354C440|nr:hypothetical protein [Oceanicaulis sp. UBA2681]|tara:strand:- start:775 stop:975 length:201 start_codon:yes stop_codon:yes gene_type:complete